MKIVLRGLALSALLLIPGFGQTQAIPNQETTAGNSWEASVAEPIRQNLQAEKTEDPAPSHSMFRAVGGLGLVTFLMIAVYFAFRKFGPRCFSKGALERNLKIIETLSMGDKRSISMIQLGNSRLLVGNTAQQINLLMTLPDPISIVSEPETLAGAPKIASKKDSTVPFKKLFEFEKGRSMQQRTHPLPEDIRAKMRQLREALDR